MSKFDDMVYLEKFRSFGQYPNIHKNITFLVNKSTQKLKRCCDLGACHGLLAHRLLEECGKEFVLAVEGNHHYVEAAVKDDRIFYFENYVTPKNVQRFGELFKEFGIELVVARRVFPEICDTGGLELVHYLAGEMFYAGVQEIILEGRVFVKNHKNLLYSAEEETKALSKYFKVVEAYENCVRMERRNIREIL